MLNGGATTQNHRVGMVIMDADMKKGGAFWHVFDATTLKFQLIGATYSSADAWLSQANAKTSDVAYTTDWTTRWSSDAVNLNHLSMQICAVCAEASAVSFYTSEEVFSFLSRMARTTALSFTPAYQFLFVQGNLTDRKFLIVDWVGRDLLI
jgi:hypothetical protein